MNEILQISAFPDFTQSRLDELFTCRRLWEADDREAFLAGLGHIRGAATDGHVGASADLMAALPGLEIVSSFAVGVDLIDLAHAREHNIIVTNTPGVLTDCVADMGMALVLACSRRVAEAERYVRAGNWQGEDFRFGTSLKHKTLGIVGFGRIGQALAGRALAFGMKIAYQGPNRKPSFDHPYFEDPADLAEVSNFLALCCPGGAATQNLIGARVLEGLGPGGYLINISRGSVVDEPALIDALEAGRIAGAGLDVYAGEPDIPAALKAMENVVLQPHHGSGTYETRKAMGDLMIDNLVAHFAGRDILTQVV